MKSELARLKRERTAAPAAVAQAASAAAPVVASAPQGPGLSLEPATVLTSYGEINYNRPTHDNKNAVADVRRFVLGYQHRFDDKTQVVTELEVEHAVASADDRGEVEVEQAHLERQLARQWAVRAGLFLIPAGLLNENPEPTAFYGVERNFVETAIIPEHLARGRNPVRRQLRQRPDDAIRRDDRFRSDPVGRDVDRGRRVGARRGSAGALARHARKGLK